jgi:hypothetical protein
LCAAQDIRYPRSGALACQELGAIADRLSEQPAFKRPGYVARRSIRILLTTACVTAASPSEVHTALDLLLYFNEVPVPLVPLFEKCWAYFVDAAFSADTAWCVCLFR